MILSGWAHLVLHDIAKISLEPPAPLQHGMASILTGLSYIFTICIRIDTRLVQNGFIYVSNKVDEQNRSLPNKHVYVLHTYQMS